jgi:hypothetical protein
VVEYDLDHVIAVVEVTFTLDVYCVPLSYAEELMPGRKVVAVGRDILLIQANLKVVDILCSLHVNYLRYTCVVVNAVIFSFTMCSKLCCVFNNKMLVYSLCLLVLVAVA